MVVAKSKGDDMKPIFALAAVGLALSGLARAEVVTATSARMELAQSYESALSPDDLWARLSDPSAWWGDDHTYSGSADNLSLELSAGGLWREDWDAGSVAHGEVLSVMQGEMLRMDAPFGPLQAMGVSSSLTLSIAPGEEGGSTLNFHFVANGAEGAGLDEMAPAVDGVWASALKTLVSSD